MGASTKKCPQCGIYMEVGKLMAWNDETHKSDQVISLIEEKDVFGVSILRCKKCHHLELVLD